MKAEKSGIKNIHYGINTLQYSTIQCYEDQNLLVYKKGLSRLRQIYFNQPFASTLLPLPLPLVDQVATVGSV
jgi:hypothetical protein